MPNWINDNRCEQIMRVCDQITWVNYSNVQIA